MPYCAALSGNAAGTTANFTAGETSRVDIYNTTTGSTILTGHGDTSNTGQTAVSTGSVFSATGWELNSFAANSVPACSYTLKRSTW